MLCIETFHRIGEVITRVDFLSRKAAAIEMQIGGSEF
jgi:hypothetical protein